MANLTIETVKNWEGSSFEVHLNGSWSETKAAASYYAATGGEYGFGAIDIPSNGSRFDESVANDTVGDLTFTGLRNASMDAIGDHQVHHNFRSPRPIDILDLGTAYILGNVAGGTSAIHGNLSAPLNDTSFSNYTRKDAPSRDIPLHGNGWSHANRRHKAFHKTSHQPIARSERLNNGVTLAIPLHKRDGPTQCGPGSPCKDDSCCSVDGKCGYKTAHCGTGCQSNCQAKAMCGIDSADGNTPCALRLCCSFYGWCGTETVHCHDPEPQFGKTPCQVGYGTDHSSSI